MPQDYLDNQERPDAFAEVLRTENNVNASGAGYSVPGGPWVTGPYRSVAVNVKPPTGTASVTVTWSLSDAAGDSQASETQQTRSAGGDTLWFRALGDTLVSVLIVAVADTDYLIASSDLDPLDEPDIAWPVKQYIDLGAMLELGNTSAGTTMVIDAACWTNHRIKTTGQGGFVTFYFLAGPQWARHEFIYTHTHGPDHGIMHFYLARMAVDVDPSEGYANPLELIPNPNTSAPLPTWVPMNLNHGNYNAVLLRNQVGGDYFRVAGPKGAPLTVINNDADGFVQGNGGPGLYAMQIRMDTKAGASSGYASSYSAITVSRIDDAGFP
jgi:hypothetical protein